MNPIALGLSFRCVVVSITMAILFIRPPAQADDESLRAIPQTSHLEFRTWALDSFVFVQRIEPLAGGFDVGTMFFMFRYAPRQTAVMVRALGEIPTFLTEDGSQNVRYSAWAAGGPATVDDFVDSRVRPGVRVSEQVDREGTAKYPETAESACLSDELRVDDASVGGERAYACWRAANGRLALATEVWQAADGETLEFSLLYAIGSARHHEECRSMGVFPVVEYSDFVNNPFLVPHGPVSDQLFLFSRSPAELCWWPTRFGPMVTVRMQRLQDGGRRFESWLGLVRHGTSFEVDREGRMTLVENWFDGEPHGLWLAVDWDKAQAWLARFVLGVRVRVAAGALSILEE